jgi:hypothetical protein
MDFQFKIYNYDIVESRDIFQVIRFLYERIGSAQKSINIYISVKSCKL